MDKEPGVAEKLRAHITQHTPSATVADNADLSFKAVNNMDYLAMVFKETMRLYPPFWATSRDAIEDDYFGDYHIPKGSNVVLPQIVMQSHLRWWDNPNAFIPERFSAENEANLDEGLYFPFSLGPRKCSGYKLAEMEAKAIFATLFPLFKVTIMNATGNGPEPSVSLRPQQLLQAQIKRL